MHSHQVTAHRVLDPAERRPRVTDCSAIDHLSDIGGNHQAETVRDLVPQFVRERFDRGHVPGGEHLDIESARLQMYVGD